MKIKIIRPFAYAFRGVEVVSYDERSQDVPQEVVDWALEHGFAERATSPDDDKNAARIAREDKDAARIPRTVKRNARS